MGSVARAKIAVFPVPTRQIDPERVVESVMTSTPENPETTATEQQAEPAPVAAEATASEPAVRGVTLQDVARWLFKRITRDRIITVVLGCISIGALFMVWYLGTKYRFEFYIRFKNVPTPAQVFEQLAQVGLSNKYLVNIAISVKRILSGFLIAIAIGVPLGLAIGKYERVRDLFMPCVEILRPIPAIAWVPMSIMLWPNNEAAIVFITFIGAFFPILLNTIAGVKNIEPNLVRAARCLGASERRVLRRVVLRAALPQVVTGIRVGLGVGWMALVAAEFVGANSGLGFLINDARTLLRTDIVIVGMFTIGIVGLAIDRTIRFIGKRSMPWSRIFSD